MQTTYYLEKPKKLKRCTGFSYIGPKLYNMLPEYLQEAQTTNVFKTLVDLEEHPLMSHLMITKFDYYVLHLAKGDPC